MSGIPSTEGLHRMAPFFAPRNTNIAENILKKMNRVLRLEVGTKTNGKPPVTKPDLLIDSNVGQNLDILA